MHSISKEFKFEAAHRLPLHEGGCRNLHGHSYRVVAHLEGAELRRVGPSTGMVADFKDLSTVVRGILDEGRWCGADTVPWDHAVILWEQDPLLEVLRAADLDLRVVVMINMPTAENMATLLASMIARGLAEIPVVGADVIRVDVWETEKSCATWEADYEEAIK